MKNYLKLVNFEFNRCAKLYFILIGLTAVSQLIAVFVESRRYLSQVNVALYQDKIPKAQFLSETGEMSMFWIVNNVWFSLPIIICITAMLFYSFFIWYIEWMGKNSFIYRLLMLPTARMNIFWSKLTTIALMIFGLIATQLALLLIEGQLLEWLVTNEFRVDLSIQQLSESSYYLAILIPKSFIAFIMHYGAGFGMLLIGFTVILFERSFRFKGMLLGLVFGTVAFLLFFLPTIASEIVGFKGLYPEELLIAELVLGLMVIGLSSWTSHYLLNKKVTV